MTEMQSDPHPKNRFQRFFAAQVPRKIMRDLYNTAKYGIDGPLSDECLYIDPLHVNMRFAPPDKTALRKFRRNASGKVLAGDWDLNVAPWAENQKYKSCKARFIDGADWQDTPAFQEIKEKIERGGSHDDCHTIEELMARYEALDRLWDTVSKTRQFTPRSKLPTAYRREHGGVFVHFNRHGEPMRYGGGFHRFSIARLAKLPFIPVQVGVVHEDFVRSGAYSKLRVQPD